MGGFCLSVTFRPWSSELRNLIIYDNMKLIKVIIALVILILVCSRLILGFFKEKLNIASD